MLNIFKYKTIKLGTLKVKELTILEYKPWGSIKVFYFCKGNAQERFHTHSFESYSFRIFGNYVEEILSDSKNPQTSRVIKRNRNHKRLLHIPKDSYHQITRSTGCCTVLVTGPWGDEFKEFIPDEGVVKLTHGRLLKD